MSVTPQVKTFKTESPETWFDANGQEIKSPNPDYSPIPPLEPVAPKLVKKPRKPNPWLVHVNAFRATHPTMSYKTVLKQAKDTYKSKD